MAAIAARFDAHHIVDDLNGADDTPIPRGEPGSSWGSAQRYRQQLILDAVGALPSNGGYTLPDGSLVRVEARKWIAYGPDEAGRFTAGVKPNSIGLTRRTEADGGSRNAVLVEQLDADGVPYHKIDFERVRGMGGHLQVVTYTSPRTGQPVTVMIVPHLMGADDPSEEYFYFDGLGWTEAQERNWPDMLRQAQTLRGAAPTLREFRDRLRLTQPQLAEVLNDTNPLLKVAPSAVSRYERGGSTPNAHIRAAYNAVADLYRVDRPFKG